MTLSYKKMAAIVTASKLLWRLVMNCAETGLIPSWKPPLLENAVPASDSAETGAAQALKPSRQMDLLQDAGKR